MNAYEILGVSVTDDKETIQRAYHDKARRCHPDLYTDPVEQQRAQDMMVQLNLAYKEALLAVQSADSHGAMELPVEKAMYLACKFLDRDEPEKALRQMARSREKTAAWYDLEGSVLMAMKQFSSALQAHKTAVGMDPENNEYRANALKAALAVKKHQKLYWRIADWADDVFHPRKAYQKEQHP